MTLFLVLEVLAVVIAGVAFSFLNPLTAGMIAGAYFVNSGVFMLYRIVKWPERFRSFTLYPMLVHVFLVSIPMVVERARHMDRAFVDVKIWGIPGPVFHNISSIVFGIVVFATIADLTRARRALVK